MHREVRAATAQRRAQHALKVHRFDQATRQFDGRQRLCRRDVVAACWDEADAAEARWLAAVSALPMSEKPAAAYRRAWSKFNRLAGYAPVGA